MAAFPDAYQLLTPDEQARLSAVFADLRTRAEFSRFCSNADLEHFLSAPVFADVLRRIAVVDPAEVHPINFLNVLGNQLQGGNVRCRKPDLVGRAAFRSDFVVWLRGHDEVDRIYKTDAALNRALDEAILRGNNKLINPLFRQAGTVKMTPRTAWVTWSVTPDEPDPFWWRVTDHKEEVCSHLALPERARSESLLLLVYSLPADVELMRPTICDASVLYGFEPPPADFEDHGLSRPPAESEWHPALRLLSSEHQPKRQPEGLHVPIPLVNLKLDRIRSLR